LNLILHLEAEIEMTNAAESYRVKLPHLARNFRAAFEECTTLVLEMPEAFPNAVPGVPARRAKLNGFPYQLIYLIDPDAVYVVALAHERKKPSYWLYRLEP
jgi:toxin ParE1/3/4